MPRIPTYRPQVAPRPLGRPEPVREQGGQNLRAFAGALDDVRQEVAAVRARALQQALQQALNDLDETHMEALHGENGYLTLQGDEVTSVAPIESGLDDREEQIAEKYGVTGDESWELGRARRRTQVRRQVLDHRLREEARALDQSYDDLQRRTARTATSIILADTPDQTQKLTLENFAWHRADAVHYAEEYAATTGRSVDEVVFAVTDNLHAGLATSLIQGGHFGMAERFLRSDVVTMEMTPATRGRLLEVVREGRVGEVADRVSADLIEERAQVRGGVPVFDSTGLDEQSVLGQYGDELGKKILTELGRAEAAIDKVVRQRVKTFESGLSQQLRDPQNRRPRPEVMRDLRILDEDAWTKWQQRFGIRDQQRRAVGRARTPEQKREIQRKHDGALARFRNLVWEDQRNHESLYGRAGPEARLERLWWLREQYGYSEHITDEDIGERLVALDTTQGLNRPDVLSRGHQAKRIVDEVAERAMGATYIFGGKLDPKLLNFERQVYAEMMTRAEAGAPMSEEEGVAFVERLFAESTSASPRSDGLGLFEKKKRGPNVSPDTERRGGAHVSRPDGFDGVSGPEMTASGREVPRAPTAPGPPRDGDRRRPDSGRTGKIEDVAKQRGLGDEDAAPPDLVRREAIQALRRRLKRKPTEREIRDEIRNKIRKPKDQG